MYKVLGGNTSIQPYFENGFICYFFEGGVDGDVKKGTCQVKEDRGVERVEEAVISENIKPTERDV